MCGMGRFNMSYDVLNRLSDSWKDLREIVVYGFGKVAQRNIDIIMRDIDIGHYCIDTTRHNVNYGDA